MAIDNRPTFGTTLLKGMLEKEQLGIEKEKLKLAQDNQKMQKEAFQLEVQKQQFELATQLAQGKTAGFLAKQLQGQAGADAQRTLQQGSAAEDAAMLPTLQTMFNQQLATDEAQKGREHETGLQTARLESAESIADKNAATQKEITRMKVDSDAAIADDRNFLAMMSLATDTANNRQAMMGGLVEAGYDPALAQAISGSSGDPDADAARLQEQYANMFRGADPAAGFASLEEDVIGVSRAMRLVTTAGMARGPAAGVTQALNRLKVEGRAPNDEDVAEIFAEIERFATDNEKQLFTSRKTRDADREQFIEEQQQLALLALQTAYGDETIAAPLAQPDIVNEVFNRATGGDINVLIDALKPSNILRNTDVSVFGERRFGGP